MSGSVVTGVVASDVRLLLQPPRMRGLAPRLGRRDLRPAPPLRRDSTRTASAASARVGRCADETTTWYRDLCAPRVALMLPATASAAKTKAKVTLPGWSPWALLPAGNGRVASSRRRTSARRTATSRSTCARARRTSCRQRHHGKGRARGGSGDPWRRPNNGDYFALIAPTANARAPSRRSSRIRTTTPPPRTI